MHAPTTLSRRDALARIAILMGGAVIGGDLFLRADTLPSSGFSLSATDVALLDEIGETIIPATDTPGAKSVGIGAFMVMMVDTCYDPAQQAAFRAGLAAVNAASTNKFGHDFLAASVIERTSLLNELDLEQRRHTLAKAKEDTAHYFRMMKQLTLLGFFTSETGASKVLRFVEVPGRYDGNAPYKKGEHAWYSAPSRFV